MGMFASATAHITGVQLLTFLILFGLGTLFGRVLQIPKRNRPTSPATPLLVKASTLPKKKPTKYIVITSIFPPTQAVIDFAQKEDWQVVVVGDKKTPKDWTCENVIYLSPEDQEKLGYEIHKLLPWNHYGRKMIGYVYAIQHGAEYIYDTDDDNIPLKNWYTFEGAVSDIETLSNNDFVNIYRRFTGALVWPRGFPLQRVLTEIPTVSSRQDAKVGVWQFLANEDPDVDAIYRLTNNTPIYFNNRDPFLLAKGSVCPFNSQNTVFNKEAFPLLFLPSYVTFRFTDILRGLVAQPILWNADLHLGFAEATVIQKRNPHDYMKDFESELPVYKYAEKVIDLTKETVVKTSNMSENLTRAYETFIEHGIAEEREAALLAAWLRDINKK